MKSLIKTLLVPVVAIFCLTACDDVPAPYYLLQRIIDQGVILEESFANSLGKWTVYNEEPDGAEWSNNYNTAYISGYQNATRTYLPTKSWLISPAIDLTNVESAYVSFEYVLRYRSAEAKEAVFVSTDLPEPDSPTIASDSFSYTSRLTLRIAVRIRPRTLNLTTTFLSDNITFFSSAIISPHHI